jgi:hypothetical protein
LQTIAYCQYAKEEQVCKLVEKAVKQAEKQAICKAKKAAIDARRASKGLPKLRTQILSKSPS